jgi:hypothetical protein
MGLSNLSFSATNINVGAYADRPARCKAGDIYVCTDGNGKTIPNTLICQIDNSWIDPAPVITKETVDTLYGIPLLNGNAGVEYVDNLGTAIWHANDEEVSFNNSTWQLKKQTKLWHLPDTELKISFAGHTGGTGGKRTQHYIARNGVQVGTLRHVWNGATSTWVETIDGWKEGDLLQIWSQCNDADVGSCKNLRILGTVRDYEF